MPWLTRKKAYQRRTCGSKMEIEALVEFFADIDVGEAYNVFF